MANKRDHNLDPAVGFDNTWSIKTDKTGQSEARKVSPSEVVEAGGSLLYVSIDIGDWNMDTVSFVNKAHGLDSTKIKTIEAIIYTDSGVPLATPKGVDFKQPAFYNPVLDTTFIDSGLTGVYFDDTNITLYRDDGSLFNSTFFDETPLNRGRITIGYTS
jgi:hypothetical protein